jgi:hypothetical protein
MKIILKLATLLLIIFGIVSPVFAYPVNSSYTPSRPGSLWYSKDRPRYYSEYTYIKDNQCDAVSMIPYSGIVLYECPSGESFWSSVLAPSKTSPLFMYFKNRKHQDDDDAADSASYY